MKIIEPKYQLTDKSKVLEKILTFSKTEVLSLQLKAGMSIPEHSTEADALVIVRSGEAKFTIGEQTVTLTKDTILNLSPNEKHSLIAVEDADMLVIKIYEKSLAVNNQLKKK